MRNKYVESPLCGGATSMIKDLPRTVHVKKPCLSDVCMCASVIQYAGHVV